MMAEAHERTNYYALATLSTISKFHVEEKYWDVQLLVDGKLFKCQRFILAVASEYFDTMFSSSDFKESNPTPDQPIMLHEVDATAFGEIIHFIYTGEVRVNDSNILQLLFLNDFLRLRTADVKEECLKHVEICSQKPDPMSNVPDLLFFAHLKEENVLIDTLNAHICQNLYHFSKDTQFLEISFENLKVLLEYGKNYILPLPGSSDVLLAIIHNWVNWNRGERRQHCCELMRSIESSNVSSDFALSLIMRLENGTDEVKLSEDVQPTSELKTFEMGIDIGDRLSKTISFNVKKMSEFSNDVLVSSSSCIVSNLSWTIICILRHSKNDDDFIFFLKCDGTDLTPEWKCYASAIFTIKSHKEGGKDFKSETGRYMFSSESLACKKYLKLNVLIDPERGFIEDDDSVTVDVHVHVDVPVRLLNINPE